MIADTRLALVWLVVALSRCSPQGSSPRTTHSRQVVPQTSVARGGRQPADTVVVAQDIKCRGGFTAYALKQEWPWSVRAGALCIMPLAGTPWPWPPGRTAGIVVMPRTPFTPHEQRAAGMIVNGIDRSELEQARVLVGAVPFPQSKYLAVEGPYP
jgi:hypothetical protein